MSRKYNALNDLKIDLAKSGICAIDGRRFTDPLCTHATPEQIAATIAMDAEVDAEYKARPAKPESMAEESERISKHITENWDFIPEIPFGEGV